MASTNIGSTLPEQVHHSHESLAEAFPDHVTSALIQSAHYHRRIPRGSSNTFIALSWGDTRDHASQQDRRCLDSVVQMRRRSNLGGEDTLRLTWYVRPEATQGSWIALQSNVAQAIQGSAKQFGTEHFRQSKEFVPESEWQKHVGTSLLRPQKVYTRGILNDASDMLLQSVTGERNLQRDREEFAEVQSRLLEGETSDAPTAPVNVLD